MRPPRPAPARWCTRASTARRPRPGRAGRRNAPAAAARAGRAGPAGSAACSSRRSWQVLQRALLEGSGAVFAMLHAGGDVGKRLEAVPEHLPARLLEAAVALGEVERVHRVAATRAPEQARGPLAHHLPHGAPQALALGFVQDRELVEVDARVLPGEDDRGPVMLAHVGTVQPGALEVVGGQPAPER